MKWTEAAWQREVIAVARQFGWRVLHVRRSIARAGQWATTTSVAGWPDLFLWRPDGAGGCIALELKVGKGRVTKEQKRVLAELAASGVRTMVARPEDAKAVLALLGSRRDTGPCRWCGHGCVARSA